MAVANAGQLDQIITLQQRVPSVDGAGQDNYTFANLASVPEEWANAQPLRGGEYFAASQMQATVDVKFTIRYRSDLDSTMRVLWRGEPYDIVSPPIDPHGRREWLELMCVTGVRDGR